MTRPVDPCRCAIYSRQSRTTDGDFSSCEAQFEACHRFIQSQAGEGWTYEDRRYDDEGRSGETLERPGLKRLLADAEAAFFDRIVIHRLDRLSRKVVHCASLLEDLRRRGIGLTIVSQPELGTSANDVLTINLLSSFAEFERDLIRDRLTDARAALKRRGRRVAGAIPYGYTTDPVTKQLVPDRSEARRVKAIFQRAAKGETARRIADHANRYGWRTKVVTSRKTGESRGGNRWTPRQVLDTLANPTYLGLVRVGRNLQPGNHEPLITRELFDQAAAQIASRRSHQTKPRTKKAAASFPLRGRLYCGQCGRLLSPSFSHYRNFRYRYYRCRSNAGGKPPCVGVSLPAEEIERTVCILLADAAHGATGEEQADHQAFAAVWSAVSDRDQRRLLPQILDRVTFDPRRSALSVTLVPGAATLLNGIR